MKIIFTLSILITFFFASSCSQDDDTQPGVPTAVLGTWEMVGFNDYIELDYATIFEFRADGTYTYSSTLREKDTDLDLGYNWLERGTFRPGSESGLLKLTRTEFLHKPYGASKLFYSEEELDKGHIEPNEESHLHYEIRDNGNTFFLPGGIYGGDVIVPDMTFERRN